MKDIEYNKVVKFLFMLIGGCFIVFFSGCDDDSLNTKTHHNEHDFTRDPSLTATTDDVVIINLEDSDSIDVHQHDSCMAGVDCIPLYFPEDVSHDFVVRYKNEEDLQYIVLLDEGDNEIVRVDRDSPFVTENIPAGTYVLEIHHGGGIDGDYTFFARPGSTYIGGDCSGCDLSQADLTGANLSGANLTSADLTGADLTNANLTDASLNGAILNNVNYPNLNHQLCW